MSSVFLLLLVNNVFLFSDLPPNQGGKYSGFGYSRDPVPKSQSQEFVDTAVSSLSSVSVFNTQFSGNQLIKKIRIKIVHQKI